MWLWGPTVIRNKKDAPTCDCSLQLYVWISQHLLSILDQRSSVIQAEIHHRAERDTCSSTHSSRTGPECNAASRQLTFWDTLQCSHRVEQCIYFLTPLRLKARLTPLVERHLGKCRSEVGVDEAGWKGDGSAEDNLSQTTPGYDGVKGWRRIFPFKTGLMFSPVFAH